MSDLILKNDSALLREINRDDLQMVLNWRNSPRVHRMQFTNHRITMEEHTRWFEGLKDRPDRRFMIICDAAGPPVGLLNWSIADDGSAEMGIYIGEESAEGKGIAGAGMALAMDYLFREKNVSETMVQVLGNNARAVGFYEKLGFKTVEILSAQVEKEGRREDVIVMKRFSKTT